MPVKEAAAYLGVQVKAIREHIWSGRLWAVKRGTAWWVDRESLEDLARPGARHAGGRPLASPQADAIQP
jgi:excisionase family DNA binding protein